MAVESVLDRALEGRELSAEDGEALFAAQGDDLHRLLSAADELRRRKWAIASATWSTGTSTSPRLREAMRLLRVQPRPSR